MVVTFGLTVFADLSTAVAVGVSGPAANTLRSLGVLDRYRAKHMTATLLESIQAAAKVLPS